MAPELADILDLYHAFAGRRDLAIWTGHPVRIDPDIHRYAPKDIATLRDSLLRMKRARDKKQKTRERLYRIEGSVDAVAVYDSDDLIVRHIRNKQASCHYGRSTKWCIAMLRAGYFEDYATHNATFFFFERKVPLGDEFDKVALMLTRDIDGRAETFTATDRQTDMMGLARVYGMRVFAIFARIHEASAAYPGSPFARVYAGTGRAEDIEEVLRHVKTDRHFLDTEEMLESVACNDATPADVLLAVEKKAQALLGEAQVAALSLPAREAALRCSLRSSSILSCLPRRKSASGGPLGAATSRSTPSTELPTTAAGSACRTRKRAARGTGACGATGAIASRPL